MALWKKATRCPAYKVSDGGVVRRAIPGRGTRPGRVLKPKRIGKYNYVRLQYGLIDITVRVACVVYEAHVGPIPPGYFVGHGDNDASDCAAANLCLVPIYAARSSTKLSPATVRRIRQEITEGHRLDDIARRRGVSRTTVTRIRDRGTWRQFD